MKMLMASIILAGFQLLLKVSTKTEGLEFASGGTELKIRIVQFAEAFENGKQT